ncbi:MAG: hypothetical protein ACK552_10320 [Microcystis sp.]
MSHSRLAIFTIAIRVALTAVALAKGLGACSRILLTGLKRSTRVESSIIVTE